jgi:hypothetical protein
MPADYTGPTLPPVGVDFTNVQAGFQEGVQPGMPGYRYPPLKLEPMPSGADPAGSPGIGVVPGVPVGSSKGREKNKRIYREGVCVSWLEGFGGIIFPIPGNDWKSCAFDWGVAGIVILLVLFGMGFLAFGSGGVEIERSPLLKAQGPRTRVIRVGRGK